MSVYDFLTDFVYAAQELFWFCLELAIGIAKGLLLALNEMMFVFPQAYIFWGMVALVLVLIMGDAMSKSLQEDQKRHAREYQRQLKVNQEFKALQLEKEQKRKASEERTQQIRQSLRLPVGAIKRQQQMQQRTQKHHGQTHRNH